MPPAAGASVAVTTWRQAAVMREGAKVMAYADTDDMIARYDERTITDLASDTGIPVSSPQTDAKVTQALAGASGAINAAVRAGDAYQVADLKALSGDDAAYLKDLVCDLAMGRLIKRRPEKYGEQFEKITKVALDELEKIRKGAHVFPIPANVAAGKPTVSGPSAIDFQRLNMIPDRTRRYYPSHKQRLPIGR